ncbi:adenylate/guanylate cyclase domain-containing protein [Antrihabitans stalactiti]
MDTKSDPDDGPDPWVGVVAAELEPMLLGGPARYSLDQIADRVGISPQEASQVWMALGFPVDPAVAMFTDDDVAALTLFGGLVTDGIVDASTQLAIARSLGHSMARLAEWQVDVVAAHMIDKVRSTGGDHPSKETVEQVVRSVAEQTVPVLEKLQTFTWRRHLAAAAARSREGYEADSATRTLAVGFADMVNYTRLTRHMDSAELRSLLDPFESAATETITRHGGWLIKTLGDEVMFAANNAADAARIALDLQKARGADKETPDLRVGVAYGPVLQRFGDLYGSVVNVAARLTGVARPGTVLVDSQFAEELDGQRDFVFKSLRPVRVRGFSRLYAHVLRDSATTS